MCSVISFDVMAFYDRYLRYEKDRVISFVPPDGSFELMKYKLSNKYDGPASFATPVYCHPQVCTYPSVLLVLLW